MTISSVVAIVCVCHQQRDIVLFVCILGLFAVTVEHNSQTVIT